MENEELEKREKEEHEKIANGYIIIDELPKGKCLQIQDENSQEYYIIKHKNGYLYYIQISRLIKYNAYKKLSQNEEENKEKIMSIKKAIINHGYYVKVERFETDTKVEGVDVLKNKESAVRLHLDLNENNKVLYDINDSTITFADCSSINVINFKELNNRILGLDLVREITESKNDDIKKDLEIVTTDSDSDYIDSILKNEKIKSFIYQTKDNHNIRIEKGTKKNEDGEISSFLMTTLEKNTTPRPCTIDKGGFLKVLFK